MSSDHYSFCLFSIIFSFLFHFCCLHQTHLWETNATIASWAWFRAIKGPSLIQDILLSPKSQKQWDLFVGANDVLGKALSLKKFPTLCVSSKLFVVVKLFNTIYSRFRFFSKKRCAIHYFLQWTTFTDNVNYLASNYLWLKFYLKQTPKSDSIVAKMGQIMAKTLQDFDSRVGLIWILYLWALEVAWVSSMLIKRKSKPHFLG